MTTQPDTTSSLATIEVIADAVDMLNDGNVILGYGEVDYAAANLLELFIDLTSETTLGELLDRTEVREFARLVVEGWPL